MVLADDAANLDGHVNLDDRDSITSYLRERVSPYPRIHTVLANFQVEALIERARANWEELHKDDEEKTEMMLPLIRLKVSCTSHPQ